MRVRNEGEFWMSFDDFAKQFSHLDLVHIGKYLCCTPGMVFSGYRFYRTDTSGSGHKTRLGKK